MKYGILNINDIKSNNYSLSARDYLENEDYHTCKVCRRLIPISKMLEGYECNHGRKAEERDN